MSRTTAPSMHGPRPIGPWKAFSRAAALLVIAIACSVLLGWRFEIDALKRLIPGAVSMNPLTAIALLLAGASLLLLSIPAPNRRIHVARSLAAIVLMVGLLKLTTYISGWDPGIDSFLFANALDADLGATSNRIAPNTALNFALVGCALLATTGRSPRSWLIARILAVASAFLCVLAVAGYLNGVTSLYGVLSYIPMAMHTAASFVLISLAILCIQPGVAPSTPATGPLNGSIQRNMLIGFGAALFLLCVIGIVAIQSTRQLIDEFQTSEREQHIVFLLEDILSEVKDMEAGVRGFIISGDAAYLQSYESAKLNVGPSIEGLRTLTAANPLWQERMNNLERLVGEKMIVSARTIKARSEQGLDAARQLLVGGDGKRLMDGLREAVSELLTETHGLLRGRPGQQAASVRATTSIIAAGSLAAITLLLVAMFILRRDLLARNVAERALRASEERFQQLAQHIDEAFWVSSGDRVIYASPAFETIWGRTSQWLCDNPMAWVDTIVPEDRDRVAAAFRATATVGEFDERYRISRPDGEQRWIQVRGVPVRNEAGQVYRVVGVAADITKEKQAEEDLERAKVAADAANRLKSEFLANMSHEIRTPMSAIIGYADLLMDRTQSPGDRLESISAIRANGDHLLTIINDILDLSKIEAGEMQLERIPCCPCQLVSEVASTMRVRASEKQLVFEVVTQGQIPCQVQSDPTRLRQILINLAGNAIKFTATGHVSLLMQLLQADGDSTPKLRFQVVDSGIGMTAEQIGRLFKPFSQADSSTTRQFGGTGLGLTISRRLAHLLGGDIVVESEPGRGSIFSLTIDPGALTGVRMLRDCSESVTQTESTMDDDAPMALSGRVLLADDGPHNQHVLSIYLRQAGVEVTIADNGRIACDLALAALDEGRPFDLILMDMQMPELDGYAATARLRETGYAGSIVALTAHAMAGDRLKCLQAGCTDYLSKPVSRENLIKMVATHVRRVRLPIVAAPEPQVSSPEVENATVLRSSGIEPVLKPYLDRFVNELPGQVELIARHLQQEDFVSLRVVIHGLRGIGGLYGLMPITKLASEAEERILRNDSIDEITASVDDLLALLQSVEGYDRAASTPPPSTPNIPKER